MPTNEIFVDSTCLFSQRSLLDSITNPHDDIVVFVDWSYIHAWNRIQMCEFASAVAQRVPSLYPGTVRDLYSLNNPIVRLLLKEQELLCETIEKLKELGLVKIIDYNDMFCEVSELGRSPDPDLLDVFHRLKMNALTAPHGVQKDLKLVPSDLDTVAYAIANGKSYHSENSNIENGYLAKVMGLKECEFVDVNYSSLSSIGVNDIEEYLDGRQEYISKHLMGIHHGHKRILRVAFELGCELIPGASTLMAVANAGNGIAEVAENWNADKKCAFLETRRRIVQENKLQPLIEQFSAYRMNPIKRARDL